MSSIVPVTGRNPSGNSFSSHFFERAAPAHILTQVKAKDEKYLLGQNPDQGENYKEAKNVFWMSIMDEGVLDTEVLSGFTNEFMMDQNADIFEVFPIKLEQRARFMTSEIIIDPITPGAGVRKVPNRQIHFKVNALEGVAYYTGQGFSADYNYLKTPKGMEYFDTMLNAVVSDIWCMIVHSALHECQSAVPLISAPEQKYAHTEIPLTVAALIDEESKFWGAVNKDPQAIHRVLATVSRTFEQNRSEPASRVIISKDCENYINMRDNTNLYYDTSGKQAVANRNGTVTRALHGMKALIVPMLEPVLHGVHDHVLRNVVQTGDMFNFAETSYGADPKKYKSSNRTIKFSSWAKMAPEEHTLKHFLHHCPEFIPLSSPRADKGKLNYALLAKLAEHQAILAAKTNVRNTEETQRNTHPFIAYHIDPKDNKLKFQLVEYFGEISECHMKSRYLTLPYKTMQRAIMRDLSDDDRQAIEDVALAVADVEKEDDAATLNNLITDIVNEHRPSLENFKRIIAQVNTDNYFVFENSPDAMNNMVSWLLSRKDGNTGADTTYECLRRLAQTNSMPLFEMISARLVLLQRVCLQAIDSWTEHDVAIPLGGSIYRPFHEQWMESMIVLGDGAIGTTNFAGLDNTVSFDDKSQHITVQLFTHFRTWISKRRKFLIAPFIRGLQAIGGKGNRYINEDIDGISHNTAEWDTPEWHEMMETFGSGEKMGDFSMIPVLQSYNSAIENQFKNRHIDMRGNFHREDFVGRMHVSTDFVDERDYPMYSNQFLTNMLYKFNDRNLPRIDFSTFNFDAAADRARVNNLAHQGTQFVWDVLQNDWRRISSSTLWGEEDYDVLKKQNSSSSVNRK